MALWAVARCERRRGTTGHSPWQRAQTRYHGVGRGNGVNRRGRGVGGGGPSKLPSTAWRGNAGRGVGRGGGVGRGRGVTLGVTVGVGVGVGVTVGVPQGSSW